MRAWETRKGNVFAEGLSKVTTREIVYVAGWSKAVLACVVIN